MSELQTLVNYDIFSAINKNEAVGNISATGAANLRDITQYLYVRIYSKYTELEDYTMKMHGESIELLGDKLEEILELKELNQQQASTITALKESNSEKDARIAELEAMLADATKAR